jgi:hypothetical protein
VHRPTCPRGELLRRRHAGGTEINNHPTGAPSFAQTALAKDDLLHHIGRRQVEANDTIADLAREFRQRRRALHADRHRGFRGWIAPIPNHDFRARLVEMARHRAAHVAESDESDLVS